MAAPETTLKNPYASGNAAKRPGNESGSLSTGTMVKLSLLSLLFSAVASISGTTPVGWAVSAVLLSFAAGFWGVLWLGDFPKNLIFLILPLLPLPLAALLCGSGWFPLLFASFFVAALAAVLYARKKEGRTRQILCGAIPLAALFIGELLTLLILRYPGHFENAPMLLFDDLEKAILAYLTAQGQQVSAAAAAAGVSTTGGILKTVTDPALHAEIAATYRELLQLALPGLLLGGANLLSAWISHVTLASARRNGVCPAAYADKRNCRVTVSTAGCLIFLAGSLLFLLGSADDAPAFDLMSLGLTFLLAYLPALFLLGVRDTFVPRPVDVEGVYFLPRPSFFKITMILITFLFSPILLPYLFALFGATAVLTGAIRRKTEGGPKF